MYTHHATDYEFKNCTGHDITIPPEGGHRGLFLKAAAHPAHVTSRALKSMSPDGTESYVRESVNGIPTVTVQVLVKDLPELSKDDIVTLRVVTEAVALAAVATGLDTRGLLILYLHNGRIRLARLAV